MNFSGVLRGDYKSEHSIATPLQKRQLTKRPSVYGFSNARARATTARVSEGKQLILCVKGIGSE